MNWVAQDRERETRKQKLEIGNQKLEMREERFLPSVEMTGGGAEIGKWERKKRRREISLAYDI